jgi:hypothetical protein
MDSENWYILGERDEVSVLMWATDRRDEAATPRPQKWENESTSMVVFR